MAVSRIYVAELFPVDAPQLYAFTFELIGTQALEVYELDAEGNRTFIEPSNYSASLLGERPQFNGGEVQFGVPHAGTTVSISIERNTPITQTVDFKEYGRFPADILEFALDKLTMIAQEIDYRKCSCRDNVELP